MVKKEVKKTEPEKPAKAEEAQVKLTDNGEDIQLKRAVEYLKSWYIFKGSTQKAG